MRSDISLQHLDQQLLQELLRAAVEDADPEEVMPPVVGPAGWTTERKAAFLRFHESRSLAVQPVETTFAIAVGAVIVGAARLCPVGEADRAAEAGVWIGRSHRGVGVGGAVLSHLLAQARTAGFTMLFMSTKPDNKAVHRLIANLGVELVHDGDTLTAWVDLTAGTQD